MPPCIIISTPLWRFTQIWGWSLLAASALLPFLPMMSVHLIFLNLIYDLSCTAIPWDNVDEEFLRVPRKWTPLLWAAS